MFYTKKHQANVALMYEMLQDQRVMIANLKAKLEEHLKATHPHGTKKDGTPRAKPGRKPA
jgi:hypothetical protein